MPGRPSVATSPSPARSESTSGTCSTSRPPGNRHQRQRHHRAFRKSPLSATATSNCPPHRWTRPAGRIRPWRRWLRSAASARTPAGNSYVDYSPDDDSITVSNVQPEDEAVEGTAWDPDGVRHLDHARPCDQPDQQHPRLSTACKRRPSGTWPCSGTTTPTTASTSRSTASSRCPGGNSTRGRRLRPRRAACRHGHPAVHVPRHGGGTDVGRER